MRLAKAYHGNLSKMLCTESAPLRPCGDRYKSADKQHKYEPITSFTFTRTSHPLKKPVFPSSEILTLFPSYTTYNTTSRNVRE